MKRYFILAAVASMALCASAQQQVMHVHGTDGTVTTIAVENIDYIDFEELVPTPAVESLGGEANCFIVTHEGRYRFAATHVDGTPVVGIDHATWLWRENGGEAIIDEVEYDAANQSISFSAGGREGNAVIAAVGADGKVVWIWHVWNTDRPADKKMNATTIMDRNLGAVSANEEDGRDTWGLVYQYGRNVPFYYIGDNQEYYPKEAMDQARKFTEVNPELGLQWGVSSYQRTEGYTIEESMANPLTHMIHKYVAGSNGGYHWAKDDKVFDYVWGSDKVKTKTNYDPCPKGYKVPFADEIDFSDITYEANTSNNMSYPTSGFYYEDQWWPMNTGRHYEDGCALYGGEAKEYCDRLFLWTAYAGPYSINFFTNYTYVPLRTIIENDYTAGQLKVVHPTAGTGAFGHAVRCVRESAASASAPAVNVKPGTMAADFTLTLADGTEKQLVNVVAETSHTLLYFNNPECQACRDTKAAIETSPALQTRIKEGSLRVVSVYADDEAEVWRSHVSDYPSTWTVAIDATQRVLTDGLYDMRQTPALYLIDSEGRVLLPDTDLLSVEALLK